MKPWPIAYPRNAPVTDPRVHSAAALSHFDGAAATIAIRSTSAGTGKNDDSAKAIRNSATRLWGVWFLAVAAFTPIPFKVATIAAGATGMSFGPFVLVSALGRGARFFLVAGILRIFGAPVRRTIEKHFDLAALLFLLLLVGGFLVIKLL